MTTPRDLVIYAGQTFTLSLPYAGTAGRGQRLHIRWDDGTATVVQILTHNGATNARVIYDGTDSLDITIGASVSALWLVGDNRVEWAYDLEDYNLSDADDVIITHRGKVIVYGNRTRPEDVTPSDQMPSGDGRYVRFDGVQSLTVEQQNQAKDNLDITPGAGNVGSAIDGATAKTTPVDADAVPLIDSAASNVLKKLSWANIKATAKAYFDTLYQAILVSGTNIKTINSTSLLGSGDIAISASPGGSGSEMQYRVDASTLGGAAGTHWDYVNGRLSIGAGTSPAGVLHVASDSASEIPMIAQGAASQTGNLHEWRNSAGSVLSRIASNGAPYFGNAKIETDRFYPYSTNSAWLGQSSNALVVYGSAGVMLCGYHPDLADVEILQRRIMMGIGGAYAQQMLTGWDHSTFDNGAAGSLLIRPGNATTTAAPTYIVGAALMLAGGAAASQAAGAAHGGALNLDGGQGYGTGSHGNVVIGATRGNLEMADARNIKTGTTTGTKIGTATTEKLGFWNATPVVQQAAVADATDATTVITQLNDLLAKLRTVGIIAT